MRQGTEAASADHGHCWGAGALAMAALALAFLILAPVVLAKTTRPYEGSFGSFSEGNPTSVAVDQSSGDIYVADERQYTVSRFDSSGAPKDFTAGPDAGTNVLTQFVKTDQRGPEGIAIDNSGGPLDGDIYVADSYQATSSIRVFAPSGERVGTIRGTGTGVRDQFYCPCRLAVDQASGDLYVSVKNPQEPGSAGNGRVWRLQPNSPSGEVTDADYTLAGIAVPAPDQIAAGSSGVYVVQDPGTNTHELRRYSPADFHADPGAEPTSTLIDRGRFKGGVGAVAVDPNTDEIYVDEGDRVVVFDTEGERLYEFGHAIQLGGSSRAIALKEGASGAAVKVYAADQEEGGQSVAAFGPTTLADAYTHPEVASFGRDGTAASFFGNKALSLVFDQADRSLYVADGDAAGIYGFDASGPPGFPSLGGFSPLTTAVSGQAIGLATDNSSTGSAGNVYLTSSETDLLYGWTSAGAPLGGLFPVDPATSPGAPAGSPKNLSAVAVDPNGDIWVANEATASVLEYSAAGVSLTGRIDTSAQGKPTSLAFEPNGDLYVGMRGSGGMVWKYTAASSYASATSVAHAAGRSPTSLAVDPVTHNLYVLSGGDQPCPSSPCQSIYWVDEYDSSGDLLDEFTTASPETPLAGVAVDGSNHDIYLAETPPSSGTAAKVRVFGPAVLLPEVETRPASELTNTTAKLRGAVTTQGVPLEGCHFEYVTDAAFEASGFSDLSSGGSRPCGPAAGTIPLDLSPHEVAATATGLSKDTAYRFRLVAVNENGAATSTDTRFWTAGPPLVETTGAPIRGSESALLQARVDPVRAAANYHFEYGSDGPCDSNPCVSTNDQPAGSGETGELAAQEVDGLTPATTYHYRVVADNGNPDGPAYGEDMTVTTRASEGSLSHGHFPGPPGSDRAWEQVSLPESGGNPVGLSLAFAEDGDRAVYGILGGTPISSTGAILSIYFAERTAGGWQTRLITPPREELVGSLWSNGVLAAGDLSSMIAVNGSTTSNRPVIWHLTGTGRPVKLFQAVAPQELEASEFVVSADTTTAVARMRGGTLDPAFPAAASHYNLYDVSSGSPHLVSLLPGNAVAGCDVGGLPEQILEKEREHMVSADGSLVAFVSAGDECSAPAQLYLRDIPAGETERISAQPLSGPDCEATLAKAVPGAVFFTTEARLSAEDSATSNCSGGNDIYRYQLDDGALECVTCVAVGTQVDIPDIQTSVGRTSFGKVGIADDGSRAYFVSPERLLPEAPPSGGTYRIDVGSGALAYVGPEVGMESAEINHDGSLLYFSSASNALNPLGGALTNGGTSQIYRYDDDDRSLTCVSCPQDGARPVGSAHPSHATGLDTGSLAEDGTFAFTTPSPLVTADQNTSAASPEAGMDAYEWRDGRQLLITDGLTNWPSTGAPEVVGIDPSGRDIYFDAATQLTPDALDAYKRLYDARIGGGIEFPPQSQPCPLEICQGTPRGAPKEIAPGSASFSGPGNVAVPAPKRAPCPRGKRKARRHGKVRCVKRRRHRRSSRHHGKHGKRRHGKPAHKRARRSNQNRRAHR